MHREPRASGVFCWQGLQPCTCRGSSNSNSGHSVDWWGGVGVRGRRKHVPVGLAAVLDALHAAFGADLGTGRLAFVHQHLHDLLGRDVAEQLAQLLFVIGDAVLADQLDEVPGRVARQRRLQKCGLADRKLAGVVPVLVKLQRPPPDIRIFLPTLLAWSITCTWRPRWPAVIAVISPAAPAPMTTTSQRIVLMPWRACASSGPRRAASDR